MKIRRIIATIVFVGMIMPIAMVVVGDVEPNDEFSSAETIGEGEFTGTVYNYYDSNFEKQEDIDYYKVLVPAGKAIMVSAYANATNSVTIHIYDSDRQVKGILSANDGALDREFYDEKSSMDYTVYLKISTYDDMINYTMNTEFRPSDMMAFAVELTEGKEIYGEIYDSAEVHWYKITLPQGKKLNVSASARGDDIRISFYREDGSLVGMKYGTSFNIEAENTHDYSLTTYIKTYAISTNKVSYRITPSFEDISSSTDSSDNAETSTTTIDDSSNSTPSLGLPIIIMGILIALGIVGIKKKRQ